MTDRDRSDWLQWLVGCQCEAVGQTSRAEMQNEWPNGSGAWAIRSTLKGKRAQGSAIPAPGAGVCVLVFQTDKSF